VSEKPKEEKSLEISEESSQFSEVLRVFIQKLDALRDALDYVMIISLALKEHSAKEHLELLERYGTELPEKGDRKLFSVPAEHRRKVNRQSEKYEKAKKAMVLLPRKFLVSFVSEFDALIGELLKQIYKAQPGLLLASERAMSFKDLAKFTTIEEARNSLIEAEVESLLRESHVNQFKALENKLKIKLTEGLASWPIFVELTQRRNLFVHADGVASAQYKRVCEEHGALPDGFVPGGQLEASRDYLICAYKCIYEIGVKLCQVIWRKLIEKEISQADDALNEIAYELLQAEKYDLATRLLEFASDVVKKHSSDKSRRIFLINLAQAYKFGPVEKSARDAICRMDWSATGDNFKICLAVLDDDFVQASVIMRRIGTTGVVSKSSYLDWPIFKVFRETLEFKTVYTEIFGAEPSAVLAAPFDNP
jgi:hypothetical protein